MEIKTDSLKCPKCANLFDSLKHLPRSLGIPCKHIICDFCVKEILKKMKTDTFSFKCPSNDCFKQIRPQSRYMSKCFTEDFLTSELVRKKMTLKNLSSEKEVKDNFEKKRQEAKERQLDLKFETIALELDCLKNPDQYKNVQKDSFKIQTIIETEKKNELNFYENFIEIEDELKVNTDQYWIDKTNRDREWVENRNKAFGLKLLHQVMMGPFQGERRMTNLEKRQGFVDENKTLEKGTINQNPEKFPAKLNNFKAIVLKELSPENKEMISFNQLCTNDEQLTMRRMTGDFIPKSNGNKSVKMRYSIFPEFKQQKNINNEKKNLELINYSLLNLKNPEQLFSATLTKYCFKNVQDLLNRIEKNPNEYLIDHFPKYFERRESNTRIISIENWIFSRKIIPSFFNNCIRFSRSSRSKGTSLHTVMDTRPILKETLIKVTLLKYDSSVSSHFGFCDKKEALSLQENKMRFNPEEPHCYVTDEYSKFKVSESEFSALSWKKDKESCFASGDEIYIHVIPDKSIVFYLKRQNVSIKYKEFQKFCDIRFYMTIVMRTNVFEYKWLL